MAKLHYYFKCTYKVDYAPTQEVRDQIEREMVWKGVEWRFCEKVPGNIEVIDKGRGVQYKAFVKYYGSIFDLKEITEGQYWHEWLEAENARKEAEKRAAEELARNMEEERQRRIREYKGPRRNPYFKWYGFFIGAYNFSEDGKCFTPVEMRSWFTFLQDMYMVHGPFNVYFWLILVNCFGFFFLLWDGWFQFFSPFCGVAGIFFTFVYIYKACRIWYIFIKCYRNKLPIPDTYADSLSGGPFAQ